MGKTTLHWFNLRLLATLSPFHACVQYSHLTRDLYNCNFTFTFMLWLSQERLSCIIIPNIIFKEQPWEIQQIYPNSIIAITWEIGYPPKSISIYQTINRLCWCMYNLKYSKYEAHLNHLSSNVRLQSCVM